VDRHPHQVGLAGSIAVSPLLSLDFETPAWLDLS
jgi:hypothetical protein